MRELSLSTLCSGSSGNSALAESKHTKLLIDAGLSGKRIIDALSSLEQKPEELSGILVTHEHIDHIRSVGILSRKYHLPIFATEGTYIEMKAQIGTVREDLVHLIRPGDSFSVGDMDVCAFSISHDAKEPVGYTFSCGKEKAALATDMGTMTKEVFDFIKGSSCVVLESNHDIKMLLGGSYPPPLKMRIRSDMGHLSNGLAAKICVRLAQEGTKSILLSHLSEENNRPALAYECAKSALTASGAVLGKDVFLSVANRFSPSLCSSNEGKGFITA